MAGECIKVGKARQLLRPCVPHISAVCFTHLFVSFGALFLLLFFLCNSLSHFLPLFLCMYMYMYMYIYLFFTRISQPRVARLRVREVEKHSRLYFDIAEGGAERTQATAAHHASKKNYVREYNEAP